MATTANIFILNCKNQVSPAHNLFRFRANKHLLDYTPSPSEKYVCPRQIRILNQTNSLEGCIMLPINKESAIISKDSKQPTVHLTLLDAFTIPVANSPLYYKYKITLNGESRFFVADCSTLYCAKYILPPKF